MESSTMEAEHPGHKHHSFETLGGHVVPGMLFVIIGCLWTHNALFRYLVARRQTILKGTSTEKLRYKNAFFSKYHSGWAHAAPVEAILCLLVVIPDGIIEIAGIYTINRPVTMVFQHLLLYFFFCMIAVANILQHYKLAVPPSSDYAFFMIFNGSSAFILTNHVAGREIVEQRMHVIQAHLHSLAVLCAAVEMLNRRSVTAALGRTLVTLAQGIWLCEIGIIIHPLPFMHTWNLKDHMLLDFITPLGVVTIAATLIIALILNVILSKRVNRMNLATVNRIVALTHNRRDPTSCKGEAASPLISDSDYDV